MTTALSDSGVQFADNSVQASAAAPQIMPLSAAVGSNALTVSLGPCALAFRSTTLSNGASTVVQNNTTLNLTVSSGSTLGTVNGVQSDIVVLAINNAGTMELAVVNIAGGTSIDETGLISTTAEGGAGAADSATVVYSATARTNVAYRVVGIVRSTQATAGTWAAAPSLVQGMGGNALDSMGSLGFGQTWQDVTGSRASGTTYYNTTGRPIFVSCRSPEPTDGITMVNLTISGITVARGGYGRSGVGDNGADTCCGIVPPGASYSCTGYTAWYELR